MTRQDDRMDIIRILCGLWRQSSHVSTYRSILINNIKVRVLTNVFHQYKQKIAEPKGEKNIFYWKSLAAFISNIKYHFTFNDKLRSKLFISMWVVMSAGSYIHTYCKFCSCLSILHIYRILCTETETECTSIYLDKIAHFVLLDV